LELKVEKEENEDSGNETQEDEWKGRSIEERTLDEDEVEDSVEEKEENIPPTELYEVWNAVDGKTKFKINNRMLFLTYSKCPVPKKEFGALVTKVAQGTRGTYKIVDKLVAQEKHKDGSIHYHVTMVFNKPFQTQSPRRFDIKYKDVVYHPNIRVLPHSDDLARVNQYISKADPALKN